MPSADPASQPFQLAMLTPTRARCGIGDYTRLLVDALRSLPEIAEVSVVSTPEDGVRASSVQALQRFPAEERRYAALGRQLNAADLAHIQHQYFFFGGVAPHKNHFAALLNAVTVPVVLTAHEIAEGGTIAWKRALIAHTNRRNFLHPAIREIIVHTEADAQRLRNLGVSETRLTVLPLAVPPALPLPDRDEARAAFGLTGKRVALMFGFLAAKKGHFLALDALKSLPDDVVLLLAGERHPDDSSDYVARLKAEVAARGLTERALFIGYLPPERVPLVMAAADIALTPFLESSGSASLAHLLAYGLPVVASDIPPHRELLARSPESLLLFPTNDAAALGERIEVLLNDASLRHTLSVAAGRFCEAHSFPSIARETLAIYRKALRA